MMRIYKIPVMLFPLFLFLFVLACSKGQPEKLTEEKLELRQELDEGILGIDEQLEALQKKLTIAKPDTQVKRMNTQIARLKEFRGVLDDRLGEIDHVDQDAWHDYKAEVDDTLNDLAVTLQEVTRSDSTEVAKSSP